MSDPITPPSPATSSTATTATASTHTIQLADGELTRVKAALASKVSHHGKLAAETALIQTERDRHQALQAEYQALLTRFDAI